MGCGLWRWCSMSRTRMWWPWQTHIFSPHTNPSCSDPRAKQGHSIQLHCNCHTGKQGLLFTTRKQMRQVYGSWNSLKCTPPPVVDTIAAGSSLLWLSQMCSLPWYYTLKLALCICICICILTSLVLCHRYTCAYESMSRFRYYKGPPPTGHNNTYPRALLHKPVLGSHMSSWPDQGEASLIHTNTNIWCRLSLFGTLEGWLRQRPCALAVPKFQHF